MSRIKKHRKPILAGLLTLLLAGFTALAAGGLGDYLAGQAVGQYYRDLAADFSRQYDFTPEQYESIQRDLDEIIGIVKVKNPSFLESPQKFGGNYTPEELEAVEQAFDRILDTAGFYKTSQRNQRDDGDIIKVYDAADNRLLLEIETEDTPVFSEPVTSTPTVSEPDTPTSEPTVTTSEPTVTTSGPTVTTSEPAVTTSEPAATTSEPAVTTSESATTEEPPVTTEAPSAPSVSGTSEPTAPGDDDPSVDIVSVEEGTAQADDISGGSGGDGQAAQDNAENTNPRTGDSLPVFAAMVLGAAVLTLTKAKKGGKRHEK